jgi:hypothetical protein
MLWFYQTDAYNDIVSDGLFTAPVVYNLKLNKKHVQQADKIRNQQITINNGYLFIPYFLAQHNKMHYFKIVIANQAKDIYQYENIKRKLLNCNVNIFFNFKAVCDGYLFIPHFIVQHNGMHNFKKVR